MSALRALFSGLPRAPLRLPAVGWATLSAVLTVAGCQPPTPVPGVDLTSAKVPLALEGDCTADSGFAEFTDEVSTLRVEVTGPDLEEPVSAEGPLGEPLAVDQVPIGDERRILLQGLNENGAPTWRSIREEVSVEEGQSTNVEMLMARIADLSCTRNLMHGTRAFHAYTRLDDGRVLLTGGAQSETDCSGNRCLSAAATAEIYDPTSGTFTALAGSMGTARMFHSATLLPDGRVLIAGGTTDAEIVEVDAANPFPIRATGAVSSIEVFDPETETFAAVGEDPGGPRVFHAATAMDEAADTYVLLSGGIDGLNDAGPNDLSNAHYSTTRCYVDDDLAIECRAWNAMVKPRAGHVVFQVDSGEVIVWGGAVETNDVGEVKGWQLERWAPGAPGFQMMSTPGAPGRERNLFFPAHAQYVDYRMLFAGGLTRNADGTFEMATLDGAGERAVVYVFDMINGPQGGIAVRPPSGLPMSLSTPRFFASAAALPSYKETDDDGDLITVNRAVVAGGFTSLSLAPSSGLAIFHEPSLTVSPLSVGGLPRTLRQARGGLQAIGIGDGTVVFTGGEGGLGATRSPLNTAEIFADPQDPQG